MVGIHDGIGAEIKQVKDLKIECNTVTRVSMSLANLAAITEGALNQAKSDMKVAERVGNAPYPSPHPFFRLHVLAVLPQSDHDDHDYDPNPDPDRCLCWTMVGDSPSGQHLVARLVYEHELRRLDPGR